MDSPARSVTCLFRMSLTIRYATPPNHSYCRTHINFHAFLCTFVSSVKLFDVVVSQDPNEIDECFRVTRKNAVCI